jgi:hypothetical protein
MAQKLKVTYLDGRAETVLVSPRAQVMTEEKFAGIADANAIRASFYMAWASLHKAGKEPADYETWLDKIAECEPVENEPADPTSGAAPSPAESSG